MNSKRELTTGYLFLLPSLLGYVVFLLFPILFSLWLAFSEWDLISGLDHIQFVGLRNFIDMWQDELFLKSLKNNVIYSIVVVPVTLAVSLCVALILNQMVYARNFLRLLYFLPYITTIVAVAIVWMQLYHPTQGPINQLLMTLGIDNPPKWLGSTEWALPSLMIMMVWVGLGYDLIIYMAGLQGVPKELYEAAQMDGAGRFRQFLNVTIPMLSPTTFFLFITRIIHSFEVFAPVNIMTNGGPGDSTSVLVYYIYELSFKFYKFGYGSAVAWVLFAIIFVITLIQWNRQKKWVTY
ncbi:sugar ABC transporter permease [Paenibacillus qinlingensis]|uniref:Multiple sugar transport system permease protein n=1 Tax=Paenibacillus qinlingensis TaxID=1837343 RepID=A0ABU1NSS4_9BACL|nr:sugar ABC transporter permease [Paenibacillus qinlingensis]MDR6550539.1 multiple sugar transport system permease protein [Paenibacillus qinlingensis]